MRITRVYLKNFTPPFYALEKTEIELDYTKSHSKLINIFIGQMGSCKTFVLGHHQPFATPGTLDIRNSEDMVLPGKRGIKEIEYQRGKDHYKIQHIYTPTKATSHAVKSYIQVNGQEMNENGNSTSFKSFIESEFGLDQNYLKLFRIGANVTNLPDMGPAERKAFVSSMLTDTEIYIMLSKKIGERNRSINAQMTMLVNRLQAISKRTEEELQSDMALEVDIYKEEEVVSETLVKEQYRLEATINSILDGSSRDSFQASINMKAKSRASMHFEREAMIESLRSIDGQPDMKTLGDEMIALRTRIDMQNMQLVDKVTKLDTAETERREIRDKLAITTSREHVETLKKTYEELLTTLSGYEKKLKGFVYTGNLASINSVIDSLQIIDGALNDVRGFSNDAVLEILRNKGKALNNANRQTAILMKQKRLAEQEMSNAEHISGYTSTHVMMRPHNCPTDQCPFYMYHPDTEKKRRNSFTVEKEYMDLRTKINDLAVKIRRYEEYPQIASRIDRVKGQWTAIQKQVSGLGVITEEDLGEVLTNPTRQRWYDVSRLDVIREKCGVREKYYELMQRVASMKNDLAIYELSDTDNLQKTLESMNETIAIMTDDVQTLEATIKSDTTRYDEVSALYLKVSQFADFESRILELNTELESVDTRIANMEHDLKRVDISMSKIAELRAQINERRASFRYHYDAADKIRRKLTDVKYTKEQYAEVCKEQAILRDIVEAVSAKKGIPLAFVKLFLTDCKDTINELIADVFEDSIEVQDFHIPDDGSEFNIPYTRNGLYINDINKASQGERAIISVALSFALIRQSTFGYNIILLDEVDGPLYKDDRVKFLSVLFKQLSAIQAEQVFVVSHNGTFDGHNVNIIMTTDEKIDETPLISVMRV